MYLVDFILPPPSNSISESVSEEVCGSLAVSEISCWEKIFSISLLRLESLAFWEVCFLGRLASWNPGAFVLSTLQWKEQKGDEKNVSVIDFDEEEIFKAFAALESGNDKIIIQPEINSLTFVIQVFVKNSKNVIELKKCKFETR